MLKSGSNLIIIRSTKEIPRIKELRTYSIHYMRELQTLKTFKYQFKII